MANLQKKGISVEEFRKNHPEKDGWHIQYTGTRLIAFKFNGKQVITDRIEKTEKGWRDLGRITGKIPWYAGYDKECSFSDFFRGLRSAGKKVQNKIYDGTITIANPLSKKLDILMLVAIVIEELIPIKLNPDFMIDLAFVLFTSNLSKVKSSDGFGSIGPFQTVLPTHDSIKKKYPSLVDYSFEKSDTYEEQAIVAILLAYDNLAVFNKSIFQEYSSLQLAWNTASEKEQLEFVVFVVAAMHNAPSSTLAAFSSALNTLKSGSFTLNSLRSDVARELDITTKSAVGTGTYAQRVVALYNLLVERGFSNFVIYPSKKNEGFKQILPQVFKKAIR